MVKKKVSKKKASSSSHKTLKHMRKHMTKIINNPAIERLDVSPVIPQAPVQVQQTVKVDESFQTEKIRIEPAQIYKDEIKQAEAPAQHDGSHIIKVFALALCCLVVLFWIGLAIISTDYNPGPRTITENVSVTTYSYTVVSLERFMNIDDIKYSENVTQLGYLREGQTDNGFIKRYIVDDKGRAVELLLDTSSKGASFDKLFIMGNTTEQLYSIKGIYRFKINAFIIEVDNITPSSKELIPTRVWSMENMTTDDVKGFTFDISRGVNKIINFT